MRSSSNSPTEDATRVWGWFQPLGVRWLIWTLALILGLCAIMAHAAVPRPVISYSGAPYRFTLGVAIAPKSPVNTGGPASTWSISPALPAGVLFDTGSGGISGTPGALRTATKYLVKASNAGGTGSTTFTASVVDSPPTLIYNPASATFTRGSAIDPLVPITGGGAITSWSISPALSAGLVFSGGTISGTPSVVKPATTYLVTAGNSGGSASFSLALTVVDLPPAFAYPSASYLFGVGRTIAAVAPVSTGGTATQWSIAPAPPAGLVLSAASGKLTGTPTAAGGPTAYTVTGSNSGGSATAVLTLTVAGQLPAFSYSPAAPVYYLATPISALAPNSTGGPVATWSVSPPLAAGLRLDPATGTLTGTPTAMLPETKYIIRAINPLGSANAAIRITIHDRLPMANLILPVSVHPGDTWMQAGLPVRPGMTCLWSLVPGSAAGTLAPDQTGPAAAFSAGTGCGTFQVQAEVTNRSGDSATGNATVTVEKGTWLVENGALALRTVGATATVLADGRILLAGGMNSAAAALYDPATRSWYPTGSMLTARQRHAAALLLDGTVLVSGGIGFENADPGVWTSCERYDPATGVWSAAGTMLSAHIGHTATPLPDGSVLVVQGGDSEIYDPVADHWTATAGSPLQIRSGASVSPLPDGTVLVAGGRVTIAGRPALSGSTELYQPGTGTWIAGPTMDPIMDQSATVLKDGRVLFAGGRVLDHHGSPGAVQAYSALYDPASGTVTATGPLAMARADATATLLPDGRVVIAGGDGADVERHIVGSTNESESFDPATGAWTVLGGMQLARTDHVAAPLPDGSVLVAGGMDDRESADRLGVFMASSERFDPGAGTWSFEPAGLGPARADPAWAQLADGTLLVVGGKGYDGILAESALYDPASRTWTATPGAPATARSACTATALADGRVLVTGGQAPGYAFAGSAEVYAPGSGTWSTTGAPSVGRVGHSATLLPGGKVLVAGGYTQGSWDALADREIYDPDTGTWAATGSLAAARMDHTATLLQDGTVLVAGGQTMSSTLDSSEIFDPATGTWSFTPGTMAPRQCGHTATLLQDGTVLVVNGYTGAGLQASSQLYHPDTGTWTPTTGAPSQTRSGHSAVRLADGSVLIAGGTGDLTVPVLPAERYDPATGTWSLAGSLATVHLNPALGRLPDGSVVLAFGYNDVTEVYVPGP